MNKADTVTVSLQLGAAGQVVVDFARADLRILGWDDMTVTATALPDTAELLVDDAGVVHLRAEADVEVHLPRSAAVHVASVDGDAEVRGLDGALAMDRVASDLVLEDVAGVTVGSVGGDLSCGDVRGAASLERVGGDLGLGRVAGDVTVQHVGGDLGLGDVAGSVTCAKVGGDCGLQRAAGSVTIESVGGDFAVSGANDVSVGRVGGDAAVRAVRGTLALPQVGGDAAVTAGAATAGGDVVARAGDGGATAGLNDVTVRAAGDVAAEIHPIPGGTYDLAAGGDMACRVPDDAHAEVRATAAGDMNVGLPAVRTARGEHVLLFTLGEGGAQVSLAAGGDLLLASTQGSRAVPELPQRERSGARAPMPALLASTIPAARTAAPGATAPAIDEEQRMVLRMLQGGTISADEANQLLAALEDAGSQKETWT